jgi:integrase
MSDHERAQKKPRHFVEKPQKDYSLYYWQPSKGLRRAGFKTVSLGREREQALAKTEVINRKIDEWRGGLALLSTNPHGTLPWLIDTYKAGPAWHGLRGVTKKCYNWQFKVLLEWSEGRGHPPMRTIKLRDAEQLWAEWKHKPRAASAIVSRACALWNYADGLDEDVIDRNPFRLVHCHDLEPRSEVWRPGQIAAIMEVAIARGRPSVALAVMIAANTAQRRGDVMALRWNQYNGETIKLTQSKTGTSLEIPCSAELKTALDDARSAVTAYGVVPLKVGEQHIVVNENTARRWNLENFRRAFRIIARYAGVPDSLQFRDLRRTATVQLAQAGCEVPEIAAFGGWSISSVHHMLKVYCPLNLTMARNGLIKLERYRAQGR